MTETTLQNLHVPERLDGESFEDYKQRRRMSKLMRKAMNRVPFWDSAPNETSGQRLDGAPRGNTYRKPKEN